MFEDALNEVVIGDQLAKFQTLINMKRKINIKLLTVSTVFFKIKRFIELCKNIGC